MKKIVQVGLLLFFSVLSDPEPDPEPDPTTNSLGLRFLSRQLINNIFKLSLADIKIKNPI